MDLREIGCEDGRWIELAQDRVHFGTITVNLATKQFIQSVHLTTMTIQINMYEGSF